MFAIVFSFSLVDSIFFKRSGNLERTETHFKLTTKDLFKLFLERFKLIICLL